MAGACSEAANRLVRIRMPGGVGGVRSNAAPSPDRLVIRFLSRVGVKRRICCGRETSRYCAVG